MIGPFSRPMVVTLFILLGGQAVADVACTFNRRSTFEGVDRLDEHGFRVREKESGLLLEQRYADGSWQSLGEVAVLERSDFTVYLHLPEADQQYRWAGSLTVYRTGAASLAIHPGALGSSWPAGRAWLYHGSCK